MIRRAVLPALLAPLLGCATAAPIGPRVPPRGTLVGTFSTAELTGELDRGLPTEFADSEGQLIRGRFALSLSEEPGAGIEIEYQRFATDDTEMPLGTGSELLADEAALSLYTTARLADAILMPIRLGGVLHLAELDAPASATPNTEWSYYGVQLGVEPEVTLAWNEDFQFSVFTALTGGLLFGRARSGGSKSEATGFGSKLSAEGGARLRISALQAEAGYMFRAYSFDDDLADLDAEFSGPFVSFGVAW
jgi:hypothetical protein